MLAELQVESDQNKRWRLGNGPEIMLDYLLQFICFDNSWRVPNVVL